MRVASPSNYIVFLILLSPVFLSGLLNHFDASYSLSAISFIFVASAVLLFRRLLDIYDVLCLTLFVFFVFFRYLYDLNREQMLEIASILAILSYLALALRRLKMRNYGDTSANP